VIVRPIQKDFYKSIGIYRRQYAPETILGYTPKPQAAMSNTNVYGRKGEQARWLKGRQRRNLKK